MSTAVITAARFNSMAEYLAPAMLAFGSKSVNGAFETVEITGDVIHDDFQWFVVFVSADFTNVHNAPPSCFNLNPPAREAMRDGDKAQKSLRLVVGRR